MSGQGSTVDVEDGTHRAAAEAFCSRAHSAAPDALVDCYVFGSTVRGDASGLASDVDVMVVLDAEADREYVADRLRDIAYDVMLAFGPVVELHILTTNELERERDRGNPFVERVLDEGQSYG